jgi:[protein-PII] uridylyltransferase
MHTLDKKLPFDSDTFERVLASCSDPLVQFRKSLQETDQIQREQFKSGIKAAVLVPQRALIIDKLLVRAWLRFFQEEDEEIALVAVGGYGRGELHPYSDIDLLVLLNPGTHTKYQHQIETFLTFLWDIGLNVGHSVRTVDECVQLAKDDITIATNLMESRPLTGSQKLFVEMQECTGPQHIWSSRDFFASKLKEQISRHHKYHDTAYNLEPNVKEGPGGLRDIQMIGWVAKRHFGTTRIRDLLNYDFLTEAEYQTLVTYQDFLWQIRYALHILTNRSEDRLLFDYQHTLAMQFGYQDEANRLAVEHFMKDYYRAIMELSRLNEMLLQLFEEAILMEGVPAQITPINKRFQNCNGFIEVTDPAIFKRYPFALLEIFLLLEERPELKGVRAATIRLIRDHRYLINDRFRNDIRCRNLFIEILRQTHGITHELRRMNRYGVLAAYIPAFERIVGLMQYDLFHVYTVDEHILMVLRNIRRFSAAEFSHELPHCSELIQRIPKREVLYLAALFHDICKGRGGDHSELGATEAKDFCLHHGMGQYDAKFVAWLVRHHLIMSMTAQRKDISDPEVIRDFAEQIGDQSHLDYLYLLTVADIRGTNPSLWNTWRDALLTELYQATKLALRRGLENPIDTAELVQESQQKALAIIDRQLPRDAIESLWNEMGDEYFMRHSADEISWHTQAILSSGPADLPLIVVREETERGGTEIFVYTHDQDYLFAMITMALDQLGLNIHDARIITSRHGYTLDTFIVLDASGSAIRNSYRVQEIIASLKDQLKRKSIDSIRVTRRIARQLKHFPIPTQVNFSTDRQNRYTIAELITADRPGLLARVGQALVKCGVRVQNAKIATIGARVEDVFFITDKNNNPLHSESQYSALRDAIIAYLSDDETSK